MKSVSKALIQGDYHNNNNRPREAAMSYVQAMKNSISLQERCNQYDEEISHAHYLSVIRVCDSGEENISPEQMLKIYKSLIEMPNHKLIDNMVCCERIGDLYVKMGNSEEALYYYSMENAFANLVDDQSLEMNKYFCRARIVSFERIGQELFKKSKYEEALDCFNHAKEYINQGLKKEFNLMVESTQMNKNITKTKEAIRRQRKEI